MPVVIKPFFMVSGSVREAREEKGTPPARHVISTCVQNRNNNSHFWNKFQSEEPRGFHCRPETGQLLARGTTDSQTHTYEASSCVSSAPSRNFPFTFLRIFVYVCVDLAAAVYFRYKHTAAAALRQQARPTRAQYGEEMRTPISSKT